MKIDFYLRYQTRFGQQLMILGNHSSLQGDGPQGARPLQYFNDSFWNLTVDIDAAQLGRLQYSYLMVDAAGSVVQEGERSRSVRLTKKETHLSIVDSWNDESFTENAFYTAPFTEVFAPPKRRGPIKGEGLATHIFRVKAPLLGPDEVVCLLGNRPALNSWDLENPLLLQPDEDWWILPLVLERDEVPVVYKYGVYNTRTASFVRFEEGDNRLLFWETAPGRQTLIQDSFVRLGALNWKGAGVAIPVFSLRSANSFGIGEFLDIKLLADWAVQAGLKLIQLLPINDTSATFTWKDSYPYAAISAFALHPIYINLQKVAGKKGVAALKPLQKKARQLNALDAIDYDEVIHYKMSLLRELYESQGTEFLESADYQAFFHANRYWLQPYAAFCYLRDRYATSDFSQWKSHNVFDAEEVAKLGSRKSKAFKKIVFHYFVQYHLHLQLKEAVEYAHKRGLVLKGDIPIGIYRYGCDAWTAPHLYNMNMQAGAPPDDFTIKGQNWGFPTYNWKAMAEDGFEWWKQRFEQMSHYFDAFRIDHILGFFRIWSIPVDAVEGIMGRFIPALPVTAQEFGERGLWFDRDRFTKPYITDDILWRTFGDRSEFVKETFLQPNESGRYDFKAPFNNQRAVQQYLKEAPVAGAESLQSGLFDLLTNVILFEEPGSDGQRFHFRILIDHISSYHELDNASKGKVWDLYIDYFYSRQDHFWEHEAMQKLPALKKATRMLICGEDLGMVPHTVPAVMNRLGILSLEIQRMPKDPKIDFFHPKNAPYLSVVTPSTHDMSTLRGWWEEERPKIQQFFNREMGQTGEAPYFCEPWVNRALVLQHLYSPAMWAIFQLQDLLGMSAELRRQNPHEERINNPANPEHYWNYRMHLNLEDLIREDAFNQEVSEYVRNSGRS